MNQVIVLAIAAFIVCMAVEWVYGRVVGRDTYGFDDTIGSLSQGLLSQCTALCTQFFQIGLYTIAFSSLALIHADDWWSTWLGWIVAIVFYDLCDYWLHRISHERAIFWAAHVVHHQSRHFNLSTALRQESAYPLLGWIFYLPMAVVGVPPDHFAIAGLVVLMYQFWIHTEHVGRLGWFDRVFSSPSNHRVHHATNDRYIDRNYGAILVVWDRLFGTFEPESEPCVYGTRVPLESRDPIHAVLQVYAAMARQALTLSRWRDRFRLLVEAPGWTPANGVPHSQSESAAASSLPSGLVHRGAALGSTAALTIALCVFLWTGEDRPMAIQAGVAIATAAGLWAIGRLLESRSLVGNLLVAGACSVFIVSASALS